MALKIFYITTEISPFASTSSLGNFSVKVPLSLQGKGHDIRTMLPKYGFVSERKYILREVIRLREIPFIYNEEEIITSAKSAFIPKTRVQVYFLEDINWFKPLTNLLYKSKNGRILSDNDMRYSFYGSAALATLPHLFWSPDIMLGCGWQTSFIPIVYQQLYRDKEFYQGIKTVHVVHSLGDYDVFSRKSFDLAGVKLPDFFKDDTVNCHEAASFFADQVIVFDTPNNKVSEDLLKLEGVKENKDKVTVIEWDDASPDYDAVAIDLEATLQKLSD